MNDKVILLVEDNADDEALTLRAFAKHHIANEIAVVRDGVEALDYVFQTGQHATRAGGANPTLILLDLMLPKIDGLAVLQRLRSNERTRHIPVVILTSSREDRDVLAGYDLGANSYVRKPVDFSEFSAAIGQLGLYWLVINVPPPRRPLG